MEDINLLCGKVRGELNKTYGFYDSKLGLYAFDVNEKKNSVLKGILEKGGFSGKKLTEKIEEYRTGNVQGSCVYINNDEDYDYDYIIVLPLNQPNHVDVDGNIVMRLSEEIMHGEHNYVHFDNGKYRTNFSGVAREFIGGSGRCEMAKHISVIPPGKNLPDNFNIIKPGYDEKKDKFDFDVEHTIGYQLAENAVAMEPSWKRAVFHEPIEKKVWGMYNELLIPDIVIKTPLALVDEKQEILKDVIDIIKNMGLKANVGIEIDETDLRGLK